MDETNERQQQDARQQVQGQDTGGEQTPGGRAMTFDQWLDSDPTYRSEFDRRCGKASQTAVANARVKWEQEQADSQDEAKKLAKMTEAQRERYRLDRDREAFAAERAAFAAEQMRVSVGAELQRRGLDAGFAKHLAAGTAEESSANLEEFQGIWNAAISSAVSGRMRGEVPPTEPKRQQEQEDPFLSGFSGQIKRKG